MIDMRVAHAKGLKMNQFDAVEEIFDEVGRLIEDICQSGFDTVHKDTLRRLEEAAELTQQYGMEYLSQLTTQLHEKLAMRRHQMKNDEDGAALLFAAINEYLYICRQKAAYDRAAKYYEAEPGEEEEYEGL